MDDDSVKVENYELTCAWREETEKKTDSDEANEIIVGSWFQRQGDAYRKKQSVVFRENSEKQVVGQAKVITDEEQVLLKREQDV